jgi:hypothetical protein
MITKNAKKTLSVELQNELMKISELAPVAPPPGKYLIAIYELMREWEDSDEWADRKKELSNHRRTHMPKRTKKSRFSTVITITAPSVSASRKSKYVTVLVRFWVCQATRAARADHHIPRQFADLAGA